MRSLRHDNYLVLESQAQAFVDWLPYPGQLRLMAMSHLASGACGVMYWNWHSIHNGLESYWKGLLSHDFEPNPTYDEACTIGAELRRLSPKLSGLRKKNRIALIVSTNTANALRWFPTHKDLSYNDVVHWVYDALFELNLECDVLFAQEWDWSGYDLIIFPELYSMHNSMPERIRNFVENGGTVFATFRSFVADKHVKIFHDQLPHGLTDVFGMTYNQCTRPVNAAVDGAQAQYWMELLQPAGAASVRNYEHRYWGKYAAVTRNRFGKGSAWYLGTMLPPEELKKYLLEAVKDAGIPVPKVQWPVVVRSSIAKDEMQIHFLLNYSQNDQNILSFWNGTDLLTGKQYRTDDPLTLSEWGCAVLAEESF